MLTHVPIIQSGVVIDEEPPPPRNSAEKVNASYIVADGSQQKLFSWWGGRRAPVIKDGVLSFSGTRMRSEIPLPIPGDRVVFTTKLDEFGRETVHKWVFEEAWNRLRSRLPTNQAKLLATCLSFEPSPIGADLGLTLQFLGFAEASVKYWGEEPNPPRYKHSIGFLFSDWDFEEPLFAVTYRLVSQSGLVREGRIGHDTVHGINQLAGHEVEDETTVTPKLIACYVGLLPQGSWQLTFRPAAEAA